MLTAFWVLKKAQSQQSFYYLAIYEEPITYLIQYSVVFFIKFISVNDFGSYTSEFCCGFIFFHWLFIFSHISSHYYGGHTSGINTKLLSMT